MSSQSPNDTERSLPTHGYWNALRSLADENNQDSKSEWDISRRSALGLIAASVGLAGFTGCRRPSIELRPYSRMPEHIVPGMPLFYATSLTRCGGSIPILVETHEGRPTKIEGQPDFEPTGGASDAFAQAAVLELYDPDRLKSVRQGGVESNWTAFDEFAKEEIGRLFAAKGAGLHILSNEITSPAVSLLREHLQEKAPKARWHTYDSVGYRHQAEATQVLFEDALETRIDFAKPDVILSLDHDFLGPTDPAFHANSRAFANRRVPSEQQSQGMNRLYVVEPMLTLTGGMADHRLPLPGSAVADFSLALAKELAAKHPNLNWLPEIREALQELTISEELITKVPQIPAWVSQVAEDLAKHKGRCVVSVGPRQPVFVHLLGHLINLALDNQGQALSYLKQTEQPAASLENLCRQMDQGGVETLVILGGNPVYDAPANLEFASLLSKVKNTIRLSLYEDETSALADWKLPCSHDLESWGDSLTSEGDYFPVQPMISPLYDSRSPLGFLGKLLDFDTDQDYEIVQKSFVVQSAELTEPLSFDEWVHRGLAKRNLEVVNVSQTQQGLGKTLDQLRTFSPYEPSNEKLELCFTPDYSVSDGRYANLSWLQELPDPITKLSWDNAALISPATAKSLRLKTGDLVNLSSNGLQAEFAVLVQPGHAVGSLTLPLGYGRTAAGNVGNKVGFNAYDLRTTQGMAFHREGTLERTGERYQFAFHQTQDRLEDRDLARDQTVQQFQERASHLEESHWKVDSHQHGESSLIEPPSLDGKHQWGMTIDLSKCIGCSACMVACQSENNIPVVGKSEVARGRALHWIRVDRYYDDSPENPQIIHEPVACVHCENAPCETVCPVNASVHSPEGLNLQVYNRCVGTRYCSNNCPYKARRFNWFDYNEKPLTQLALGPLAESGMPETLKMQKNPDVTVRMRGVMEKCTYCVQRIEQAKVGAKLRSPGLTDYTLADGQVTPACAQSCPTDAIVFGDLSDTTSRVSQLKQDERQFDLLDQLNTKARTSYLSRIRNPNDQLLAAEKELGKAGG